MAHPTWIMKHPQATLDMLGFIPLFLDTEDERPAKVQLRENYGYGWAPLPDFKMLPDGNLSYPGDPPVRLLAETKLRDETIRFYDCAWVAVIQPDGSFEASRMD